MNIMDKVSKRIIELREEKGETQQELADAIGITRQSLSRYEIAARTINVDVLGALAQHFGVSADYLLGLSDVKSTEQDVKTACAVTGLSQKAVENITEIANMYDTTLIKKYGLKVNLVAEPTYEEKTRVIKRFFESKELKEIAMAIQEAVIYQQAHNTDRKKVASLMNKLSLAPSSHSKDEFKNDEPQLSDIYTHKYDRIARTYIFDAYEKISGFVNNISKEQEDNRNGKHNSKEE